MPLYHLIALLIHVQLSAGISMLTGLKTELIEICNVLWYYVRRNQYGLTIASTMVCFQNVAPITPGTRSWSVTCGTVSSTAWNTPRTLCYNNDNRCQKIKCISIPYTIASGSQQCYLPGFSLSLRQSVAYLHQLYYRIIVQTACGIDDTLFY